MALLHMAAFDPRTFLLEGYTTSGTIGYNTSTKRTGTAALEISRPTNTGAVNFAFNSGSAMDRAFYARVYMNVQTIGSGFLSNVMSFDANGGTFLTSLSIALGPGSQYRLSSSIWRNSPPGSISLGTSVNAFNTGQWYLVEVKLLIPSSGNATYEVRVDGVTEFSNTVTNMGNTSSWAPRAVKFGNAGTGNVTFFDDFQLNDDTGSNNNTWVGAGQVLCLTPTSDVSIGTWTGGAGGTTSLFDAINNQPPVGVADGSDTNTSQINSTGSGTATFSFPTYASQGIGASNTILGVRCISAMGRGATLANVGSEISSNPTGPAISQAAVAQVGTYSSNWTSRPGTIIEAPSVDRYAAIEAQVSASAATGQCCALAVQVAVAGTLTSAGVRHTKSLSDSVTLSDNASPVHTPGATASLKTEGWSWNWKLGRGFDS